MLSSLMIKNFRALEDFEVSKLGRVNLIVGTNNSGKSSVLEALRIFAGNASTSLLNAISASHGEGTHTGTRQREDTDTQLPFEAFFSGRSFPKLDGIAIEIGSLKDNEVLSIEHGRYGEFQVSDTNEDGESYLRLTTKRLTKEEAQKWEAEGKMVYQALYIQKGLRTSTLYYSGLPLSRMIGLPGLKPCSVIPTQFISLDELADEWDDIALTENQAVVQEALRLILPEFEAIAFVRNENQDFFRASKASDYNKQTRTAKVKLKSHPIPVPLNSLGDGMLRVLQLALKIFSAKDGFLLIDEFENGLHYSVQEKIWGLVFDLAQKLDVQVFATTHSWDCIKSFAKVAYERKDIEGILFQLGRSVRTSDKGRVIATVYEEEELLNLTQADIEVR